MIIKFIHYVHLKHIHTLCAFKTINFNLQYYFWSFSETISFNTKTGFLPCKAQTLQKKLWKNGGHKINTCLIMCFLVLNTAKPQNQKLSKTTQHQNSQTAHSKLQKLQNQARTKLLKIEQNSFKFRYISQTTFYIAKHYIAQINILSKFQSRN